MNTTWIVTYCKGYNRHLQRTIGSYFSQEGIAGVLLVDYDCPDGCGGEILGRTFDKRLAVMQVGNRPVFSGAKARNIGIVQAVKTLHAARILVVDCDVKWIGTDCVRLFDPAGGVVALENPGCPGGHLGTAMMTAEAFETVRGYDESHVGYGHDDTDFYRRVERAGFAFEVRPVPFEHMDTTPQERCRFLGIEGITADGCEANLAWAHDSAKIVNPHGYGEFVGQMTLREPHERRSST